MRINKIRDRLDFDVETQKDEAKKYQCMHDCPIKGNIPIVKGMTWDSIVGTAGLRDVNSCHVETTKGIIGWGPILSEWN